MNSPRPDVTPSASDYSISRQELGQPERARPVRFVVSTPKPEGMSRLIPGGGSDLPSRTENLPGVTGRPPGFDMQTLELQSSRAAKRCSTSVPVVCFPNAEGGLDPQR